MAYRPARPASSIEQPVALMGDAPAHSADVRLADVLGELVQDFRNQRRTEERLTWAAHYIAGEAHKNGLHPEQMLVLVKQEWLGVREIRQTVHDDRLGEVQKRLISECIEAFYAKSGSRDEQEQIATHRFPSPTHPDGSAARD